MRVTRAPLDDGRAHAPLPRSPSDLGRVVRIVLALVLGGCGGAARDPAAPPDPRAPGPEAAPTTAVEPPPRPVQAEAYFVGAQGRIVHLDAQGRLTDTGLLGRTIAHGLDGQVYSLTMGGRVEALSRGTVERVVLEAAGGDMARLAVESPERLWIASHDGLRRFEGGAWTTVSTERSLAYEGWASLAVDGHGAAWVIGYRNVFHVTDGRVEPVLSGEYLGFARTPDGSILAVGHHALMRWNADAFAAVELELREGDEIVGATYRDDGALIVATEPDPMLHVLAEGAWRVLDLRALGVPARWVTPLATDGRGRTWASTDAGLVVLDGSFALERWIPAGSVPALRGGVRDMLVLGGGPAPPEAGRVDGRVHGRLLQGDEPVARQWLFLCADVPECAGGANGPGLRETTTNADGTFDLWEVVPGEYGLAMQREGEETWRTVEQLGCCTAMQPGTTFDLGDIDLARRGRRRRYDEAH